MILQRSHGIPTGSWGPPNGPWGALEKVGEVPGHVLGSEHNSTDMGALSGLSQKESRSVENMYPKSVFEQFWKPSVNISIGLSMFTWRILCSTWEPTKHPGLLWGGPQELPRCLWDSLKGSKHEGFPPRGGSRAHPRSEMNVTNTMVLVFSLNEGDWGSHEGPGGSWMHGSGILARS